MAVEVSNELKCSYFHHLKQLRKRREYIFTQLEIGSYLGVSRRKIIQFEGEEIDLTLLFAYGDILGMEIELSFKIN
jgi:DNA-binding XRE family transcriptional regulator